MPQQFSPSPLAKYTPGQAQIDSTPSRPAIEAGPTGTQLIAKVDTPAPRVSMHPLFSPVSRLRSRRPQRPAPVAPVAAAPPRVPTSHRCTCGASATTVILSVLAGVCGTVAGIALVLAYIGG